MADIWDGGFLLMEHDPLTGKSVWMKEEDGNLIFRVDQPLDAIFSANAEAESATNGKPFGDYVRVASIPHHLVYQNGVNDAVENKDDAWLSRFLNNSDNSKFRTSRGAF